MRPKKYLRVAPRQTPTGFPGRETTLQAGVVLFPERRLVHVATQHLKQILQEASLDPTPTEAVVHPPAIPPRLDETDRAEAAQVPRDLVLRHAKRIDELADAELLPTQ
jgi:hypothetical protein